MHSAMCFACTAQGGASGLNAETLVWLQFDIDIRFTIALVKTGRGSYTRIQFFGIDYKRSSPKRGRQTRKIVVRNGGRVLLNRDWTGSQH